LNTGLIWSLSSRAKESPDFKAFQKLIPFANDIFELDSSTTFPSPTDARPAKKSPTICAGAA
jgi:hypothetical protein